MLTEKEEKNHKTILMDAEKHFGKIQLSSLIKTLNKLSIEGNFLNRIDKL